MNENIYCILGWNEECIKGFCIVEFLIFYLLNNSLLVMWILWEFIEVYKLYVIVNEKDMS